MNSARSARNSRIPTFVVSMMFASKFQDSSLRITVYTFYEAMDGTQAATAVCCQPIWRTALGSAPWPAVLATWSWPVLRRSAKRCCPRPQGVVCNARSTWHRLRPHHRPRRATRAGHARSADPRHRRDVPGARCGRPVAPSTYVVGLCSDMLGRPDSESVILSRSTPKTALATIDDRNRCRHCVYRRLLVFVV